MYRSRLKDPNRSHYRKGYEPSGKRDLKKLHKEFHVAGSVIITLAMAVFFALSLAAKQSSLDAAEIVPLLVILALCLAAYNLLTLIVFVILRTAEKRRRR